MALESNVAVSEDLLDPLTRAALEVNGRLVLLRTEQDGRVVGIIWLRLRRISEQHQYSLIQLSEGMMHGSEKAMKLANQLLEEARYWLDNAKLSLGKIRPGKLIKQPWADRLNLEGKQASSQGTVTISAFLFQ